MEGDEPIQVETILRMGKRRLTRMMEMVNLRYIVSTFINTIMYPQYNDNMIIKNKKKRNSLFL
jgi:hypothetical protein